MSKGKVYIELGEAINAIKSSRGNCDHRFYEEGLMDACYEIIGLKPADVKPVRHGRWLDMDSFDAHYQPIYQCSECGKQVADNYISCHKYCLHCGAKMDRGSK
jgi:hypothetical protein